MATSDLLSPIIREKFVKKLSEYSEISFAMQYGSAAEAGMAFNDLDVAVWVDRTAVPGASDLDFAFALANELEALVPFSVDVRVVNHAPLGFDYNVSCGQALIVNDQSLFYNFLERTWDEYFDFRPVAMKYLEELR